MVGKGTLWIRSIAIAEEAARTEATTAQATDPEPTFHHYILIRTDIDIGRLGAQITHASRESSKGQDFPRSTRAVVLGIESEQRLLELEAKLVAAGLKHTAIREPDAPFNGAITAIGIPPMERTPALKKLTGKLKKLGE